MSGLYPDDLAAQLKSRAGQKYQPSNGTEGEVFFGWWCCHCARDAEMNGTKGFDEAKDTELCPIIARTMAFKPSDAEYPSEWQYGADGQPKCTAFVPLGDSIPTPRCQHTKDMFAQATP